MSQQIINVGSSANDGTGDPLRVSQQKANSNFTELYNNKQDSLTDDNFGTFSNSLTTEDAIVDADLINYTDVSDTNKQKKTTWANIKAKLKAYFDIFYQDTLVSGTNIKTINGSSLLGSGDLGVGGSSFQGDWDAETNTPTLANGTGTTGHEYKVTASGYQLSEIYLPNDIIAYDGAVWFKKQDNNQDIATRYPISYINCTTGTGNQSLGEADYNENAGTSGHASPTDSVILLGAGAIQNARLLRTTAAANGITNIKNNSWTRIIQNMGFYAEFNVAGYDASTNTARRGFHGLAGSWTVGNTDPSGATGYGIGLAFDSADTNVQIFLKTTITANLGVTKVDTGWNKTNIETYSLKLFREQTSSKIFYIAYNATTKQTIKGMVSLNPASVNFGKYYYVGSGANAIATGFHHLSTTIKVSV